MALQLDDLRLPPLDLPKCAIVGCDEMPTEWLPGSANLPTCKPHADRFRTIIAERNYEDFRRFLSEQGITDEPLLTDGQEVLETRRCCVPGCNGKVISGTGFEPFKQPGQAWVCQSHYDAANYVVRRQNGERLIRELASESRQPDPERLKRDRAVRALCAEHHGRKNYIELVCRDLQQQRVALPKKWFDEWQRKRFVIGECDWLRAYQSSIPKAKPRIQKYVSRLARIRVNLNK